MKINQENFLRKTTKLILFLCMSLFFFSPIELFGQKVCFNYKGSWSSWKEETYGHFSFDSRKNIYKYSNGLGYSLETDGRITFFDFKIPNYTPPTKKEKKEHQKTKEWYTYKGTVSYYVSDKYPTAESLAKAECFVMPDPRYDTQPTVKRTANATIKIAPYKERPNVYNIWFDDIGVGVDVTGLRFKGDKRHKNKGRVAANICMTVLLLPLGWTSWIYNPVYD